MIENEIVLVISYSAAITLESRGIRVLNLFLMALFPKSLT